MEKYVIQIFSGGWIVRNMKGEVLVKTSTCEEAEEWIEEQEEISSMKHWYREHF